MSSKENFREIAEIWLEKLESCQFAGEIYIDEDQMRQIAGEMIRKYDSGQITADQYATILVITAVNCAYHYYDDEGFWPHFARLVRKDLSDFQMETFGRTIEVKLDTLGLLRTRRTGPFRYVGALLEQCGVSRRYIAPFARILRELSCGRQSWDSVVAISYREFQRIISELNCSKYLKSFLMDAEGWKFTIQVCQLLQYYELGIMTLTNLTEIPGFQPHFWQELISHLALRARTERKKQSLVFRPRICFFPEKGRIGLAFPSSQYLHGMTQPSIALPWDFPVTLFDRNESLWSLKYSGTIKNPDGTAQNWEIDGWVPDGRPVVFDIRHGLISRGAVVSPGEYFLLVPRGYTHGCSTRKNFGSVMLPGDWNYHAFQVQINVGDFVAGYNTETERSPEITLEWSVPEKKQFVMTTPGLEVFSGSMPEMTISDFSLVESNIVGLFFETNFGTGWIRNKEGLQDFRQECNKRVPVVGRIWLSYLSRSMNSDSLQASSQVEFCLLPELGLKFENRLYGFDEEAVISGNFSCCKVIFEGCKYNPDDRCWIVPSNLDEVSGNVTCGEVSVSIKSRLFRARMFGTDGRSLRYLMGTDLVSLEGIILSGYPEGEAVLFLDGESERRLAVKYDTWGRSEINPVQIMEFLRHSPNQISEVLVSCMGSRVTTGTVIVDLENLKRRIFLGEKYSISVCSAMNLKKLIHVCERLCIGERATINLNNLPGITTEFNYWVNSIFACASLIDNTDIRVEGRPVDWKSQLLDNKLRQILEAYASRNENDQIANFAVSDIDIIPSVARWQRAVREAIGHFTPSELISSLQEWAVDVKENRLPTRSQISKRTGGTNLTRGWVNYYHAGRYEDTLQILASMERESPIMRDTGNFLLALLFLRQARIRSAFELLEDKKSPGIFPQEYYLLRYIISVFLDHSPPPLDIKEFTPSLPLRPEDRVLLDIALEVQGNSGRAGRYGIDTDDWLVLLFILHISQDRKDREIVLGRIHSIRKSIPSSPELSVVEKIKKLAGGSYSA